MSKGSGLALNSEWKAIITLPAGYIKNSFTMWIQSPGGYCVASYDSAGTTSITFYIKNISGGTCSNVTIYWTVQVEN
jgi:hypothetical protein